jgi:CheY-like chemotaxis protein
MAKILIVEDNEMNRDMLSRRLIRRGFAVLCAVDGGQALEMARAEKPDLILMDLRLPDIGGREVTRMLKADPATGSIPIIALTAHAMEAHREEAMKAGCDDYDTKPVDLARLLEKINRLLGGAGHRQNQEPAERPAS